MNNIPRLLVIDDSEYICQQIEQIFKNESIELQKAHDGAQALQQVSNFQPDLILLDVILPDTEGYELYHKIKAIDKNQTSIIFLTSKDRSWKTAVLALLPPLDKGPVGHNSRALHFSEERPKPFLH